MRIKLSIMLLSSGSLDFYWFDHIKCHEQKISLVHPIKLEAVQLFSFVFHGKMSSSVGGISLGIMGISQKHSRWFFKHISNELVSMKI